MLNSEFNRYTALNVTNTHDHLIEDAISVKYLKQTVGETKIRGAYLIAIISLDWIS